MILYVDETENNEYFILTGLLVDTEYNVELAYKKFKNSIYPNCYYINVLRMAWPPVLGGLYGKRGTILFILALISKRIVSIM